MIMSQAEHPIVELDVRPHLSKKLEPFQLIMDTVKGLHPQDVFVLHAPFKPTPLLGILKMKGYSSTAERISTDHWVTTFVHKKNKTWPKGLSGISAVESRTEAHDELSACAGKPDLLDMAADADFLASPVANRKSVDGSVAARAEAKVITLDNRGLEPPQPMMRTLAALDRCQSGEVVLIHNDRVPVFLIEELNRLGCSYTVDEQADGTAKVSIVKG